MIGLGGGTVMELAKLLRLRPLDHDFEVVAAALRGAAPWPRHSLTTLWLVPTTAGSGSEVTRRATVWDTDRGTAITRTLDEPFGWANRAWVDPRLSLSCPAPLMRNSALDALAHALEAIWNINASPLSDQLAMAAARQIIAALPDALADPDDAIVRAELSLAALHAGLAFAQTGHALAHSLSYAVTLEQGLPHGHACAIWLPTTRRLALDVHPRVDQLLRAIFRCDPSEGAERLEDWLTSVGVDSTLSAHAVHDAGRRIASALASERGPNIIAAVDRMGLEAA